MSWNTCGTWGAWAVCRIRLNLSRGLLSIRAEHLRQWLQEAIREEDPNTTHWLKVVAIVQAEFCDMTLANDITWQMVFLIQKDYGGDFRGIGLVEILWKTVTGILNRRFTSEIHFHDIIHGFREGRGTGATALEYKILQQITAMKEAVLYDILLDLQKAYDDLDWDRCLGILAAHGVFPRALQLLWTYWGRIAIVYRARGYYGHPFKGYRGVTQGDPLYSTIFNLVVDAVICHWVMVVSVTESGVEGIGALIQDLTSYFYADNRLVMSTQLKRLQRALNVLTNLFNQVGLWKNKRNTVSMACQTRHMPVRMSVVVYERRTTGMGPTYC